MSPRRNRPARNRRAGTKPPDPQPGRGGLETVETWGGYDWRVRHIPGPAAAKTYRCPGCDQEIRPGVPHVVVWPVDGPPGLGGDTERRHWHTACWRARERRRPSAARFRR